MKTPNQEKKVAQVVAKLDGVKLRDCTECAGVGYFPNNKTLVGSGLTKKTDCETCEGKGHFPDFTEEDKKEFMRACNSTWQAIGSDVEALEDPSTGRRQRMTQAGTVEITLDADYMDNYGSQRYGLPPDEMKAHKRRMRQIRYSKVATKWCKEALFGR